MLALCLSKSYIVFFYILVSFILFHWRMALHQREYSFSFPRYRGIIQGLIIHNLSLHPQVNDQSCVFSQANLILSHNLKKLFISIIFHCAGSLLLNRLFSSCCEQGLLSSCGHRPLLVVGFLEHGLQGVWFSVVVARRL